MSTLNSAGSNNLPFPLGLFAPNGSQEFDIS